MLEIINSPDIFAHLQWFAAICFVPVVVWYHCFRSTVICRWTAMISGYVVQIGFFLLLDDVGFSMSLLVLISSLAGYFWVTTTVTAWPRTSKASPAKVIEQLAEQAAVTS